MTSLEFFSPVVGITIVISEAVQSFFQSQQRGYLKREHGGQLFAAEINPGRVDIGEATLTPGLWSRPFSYKPNIDLQQAEIKEKFSMGLHYVGDWHTHPQRRPVPSQDDEQYMRDLMRLSKCPLKYFIMIILGTAPLTQGLYISIGDSRSSYPLNLRSKQVF